MDPSFKNYDPAIVNEYDLEKAKFHLKKSGHVGTPFVFHTFETAYGGAVDAASLFAESFAKVGAKMAVSREAKDSYWADVWNKLPFCSCYWGPRPDEDMISSIAYLSDAPWNDSRINIPRIDELVIAARGVLDAKKCQVMYSEIQMLIAKQGGTTIPEFGQDVSATSKKIGVSESIGGGHFLGNPVTKRSLRLVLLKCAEGLAPKTCTRDRHRMTETQSAAPGAKRVEAGPKDAPDPMLKFNVVERMSPDASMNLTQAIPRVAGCVKFHTAPHLQQATQHRSHMRRTVLQGRQSPQRPPAGCLLAARRLKNTVRP